MDDYAFDADFDWLAEAVVDFQPDDKPTAFPPAVFQSPASYISSGSSSSSDSPKAVSVHDIATDPDSDSDSNSDSDVELFSLPTTFHVIDNIAYETRVLTPLDESDAPYIPPIPSPQPILLQHEARLPPPHRRQEKNTLVFVETDPDADDESDGNASDDEYLPSPPLKPHTLKRCATTPLNQFGIAAISTGLTSTSAFGSHQHPVKRPRASPPSRNIQATPFSPSPTSAGLDAPSKSNPWACPHCSWVQRNRRTPDLKRHIRTHTRLLKPSQWVCCGVPVEEAASYAIRSDSESRLHDGRYVVGGCWKEFSRRDALKRHLDNSNIGCVGNLNAFLTED